MALALDSSIPDQDWYSHLERRISKPITRHNKASNLTAVPCYVKRFLNAEPCTYLEPRGSVKKDALTLSLAEVMVSDMSGSHPVSLWKDETSEIHQLWNKAKADISNYDKEGIAVSLDRGEWIQRICGEKGTFTEADLLPVGERNKPWENTMAGQARKLDTLIQMAELRRVQEAATYRAQILDLGKAVTEYSDLKTYMRISLFLFLAVHELASFIKRPTSGNVRKDIKDIGGQ